MIRIFKFLNFFLIFLSIILVVFTIYKIRSNDGYSVYFQYLIFFTFLIVFFVVINFFKDQYFINISLVLYSLIFSSYFVELIVPSQKKNIDIQKLRQHIAQKLNIKFDKRTSFEVFNDLNASGIKTVPYIHPSEFISSDGLKTKNEKKLFSFSGISNINTILCNENGYWTFYQSDNYGFNNPNIIWKEKELDAIIVGDSYGHGACVKQSEQLGNLISNKIKVINLSYSGNGPLTYLASLKEYLKKKNTKYIIWLHYEGNDMYDLEQELNSNLLKKYLTQKNFSQNLLNRQKEIDKLLNNEIKVRLNNRKNKNYPNKTKYNVLSFIKLTNVRSYIFNFHIQNNLLYSKQTESFYKKVIDELLNFSKEKNIKIVYVYLPSYARYDSFIQKYYLNKQKKLIKNTLKNKNIAFLDFDYEITRNNLDPKKNFPFRKNGHYTPGGYKKLSNFIVDKLNF